MSSKSSDWQEDIDIDTDKDKSTGIGTSTDLNAVLTGLERKYKAQMNDLINHHKEDSKKMYVKYDRQKEFISIAAHELKSPITPILGVLELMEYEFEEAGEKDEIVLKKEPIHSYYTMLRINKEKRKNQQRQMTYLSMRIKSGLLKSFTTY